MTTQLTASSLADLIVAYAARIPGADPTPRKIGIDTELAELGFDSVDVVLLAAEVEDTFGVALDPAFFLRLRTIGLIMGELQQRNLLASEAQS